MSEKGPKRGAVPEDLRSLRACLFCSLIQTGEQFEKFGCVNCDPFLHIKGSKAKVGECTSSSFEGYFFC
jgi:transcription elongation factor SPT4